MLNSKEILSYTQDLNIMFVEDHDELRINTAHILNKFYNSVSVAVDGRKALELYNEDPKKYDIIISDIQMPYLNGVELAKKIHSINPEQVIIILSAHDDSMYLKELININIEHFLSKPIDYQDFLQVLLKASKRVGISKNENKSSELSNIINLSSTMTFDKDKNLLYNKTTMITLTKFEIIFMNILTDNIGNVFSNDDITLHYSKLGENLDASNIRKLVSKLRKKLDENIIESLYGVGYRLIPFI